MMKLKKKNNIKKIEWGETYDQVLINFKSYYFSSKLKHQKSSVGRSLCAFFYKSWDCELFGHFFQAKNNLERNFR